MAAGAGLAIPNTQASPMNREYSLVFIEFPFCFWECDRKQPDESAKDPNALKPPSFAGEVPLSRPVPANVFTALPIKPRLNHNIRNTSIHNISFLLSNECYSRKSYGWRNAYGSGPETSSSWAQRQVPSATICSGWTIQRHDEWQNPVVSFSFSGNALATVAAV